MEQQQNIIAPTPSVRPPVGYPSAGQGFIPSPAGSVTDLNGYPPQRRGRDLPQVPGGQMGPGQMLQPGEFVIQFAGNHLTDHYYRWTIGRISRGSSYYGIIRPIQRTSFDVSWKAVASASHSPPIGFPATWRRSSKYVESGSRPWFEYQARPTRSRHFRAARTSFTDDDKGFHTSWASICWSPGQTGQVGEKAGRTRA